MQSLFQRLIPEKQGFIMTVKYEGQCPSTRIKVQQKGEAT